LIGKNRVKGKEESPNEVCCETAAVELSGRHSEPIEQSCCEHPAVGAGSLRETEKRESEVAPNMEENKQSADLFKDFMKAAGAEGAVDARTKRMVSIALAIAQRCRPCLEIHIRAALKQGIARQEIDEVAWVAVSFCGCPAKMFYEEVLRDLKET